MQFSSCVSMLDSNANGYMMKPLLSQNFFLIAIAKCCRLMLLLLLLLKYRFCTPYSIVGHNLKESHHHICNFNYKQYSIQTLLV